MAAGASIIIPGTMNAILHKYICALCGTEFHASGVPEMSCGEFVLRTELGEEAYLDALNNTAFNEVLNIVKQHPSLVSADANKIGALVQGVFGVACDLSPLGRQFHIDLMPICPICACQ